MVYTDKNYVFFSENHTKRVIKSCQQDAEVFKVKPGDTIGPYN